jgi:hypothetical protein
MRKKKLAESVNETEREFLCNFTGVRSTLGDLIFIKKIFKKYFSGLKFF